MEEGVKLDRKAIPKRRLGRTGLMVSCMGLGGMGVMNQCHVNEESAIEVVTTAIDSGINFIDTARGYFNSEEIIGKALQQRPGKAIVTTKTYMRSADKAAEEIQKSMETLQVKKLPLIQIHHLQYMKEFERITAPGGAMEAVRSFRKQGLIDFVGISSHNPEIIAGYWNQTCLTRCRCRLTQSRGNIWKNQRRGKTTGRGNNRHEASVGRPH